MRLLYPVISSLGSQKVNNFVSTLFSEAWATYPQAWLPPETAAWGCHIRQQVPFGTCRAGFLHYAPDRERVEMTSVSLLIPSFSDSQTWKPLMYGVQSAASGVSFCLCVHTRAQWRTGAVVWGHCSARDPSGGLG